MVSTFEIRWLPASVSSSTVCGGSAFVLQGVVSRVQPLRPTRGAVCPASDLVSESWRLPVLHFASAGWTPRRALLPRNRPFFARCRERLELRARPPWGKTVAYFDKLLCLPARRSKPVLPSERHGPEHGTIEQTRTGRPTQVAQADGWRSFKRRRPMVVLASGSGGGLHGPLA
jgi:hypothetical protein